MIKSEHCSLYFCKLIYMLLVLYKCFPLLSHLLCSVESLLRHYFFNHLFYKLGIYFYPLIHKHYFVPLLQELLSKETTKTFHAVSWLPVFNVESSLYLSVSQLRYMMFHIITPKYVLGKDHSFL